MVMGGTRRSVDGDGNVSAIANVWEFTVMDKAIADKVQQALESGSVVTLKYHQSFGHNPFTRNTSYTVVEVVAK